MKSLSLIFLGGGLGSIVRFLIGKAYGILQPAFPLATLTSNFLSCLVFGVVLMLGADRINLNHSLKLLMITGFCGGFSTYSAFTFETFELFKNGQHLMGLSNIVLNFVLSITGLYLGMMAYKLF